MHDFDSRQTGKKLTDKRPITEMLILQLTFLERLDKSVFLSLICIWNSLKNYYFKSANIIIIYNLTFILSVTRSSKAMSRGNRNVCCYCKFPEFSVEWFAFQKFNNFWIFWKFAKKFPFHFLNFDKWKMDRMEF